MLFVLIILIILNFNIAFKIQKFLYFLNFLFFCHLNIHLQKLVCHYYHILFLFHFFDHLNIHLQILIYHPNILFLFHFFYHLKILLHIRIFHLNHHILFLFHVFYHLNILLHILIDCYNIIFLFHFFYLLNSPSNINSPLESYSFTFPFFNPFKYSHSNFKMSW